ncbi:hypothetical protein EUGRSUZ_H05108 [Eucalyptus grandis]|uniref:Uncharacterized protein n=2 Tax=Eucalyptus grandis TaxID=71139 RepID=A0ACC3K0F1_EUCGR|nr:hypothetical protein EUGRSUZ_H05108 [Eucalyptus grandis]
MERVERISLVDQSGTLWTASAHISLVMVGHVLSVAWDISRLGWIAGPAAMCLISCTCYYTSRLLCDCYRTGDSVTGKRNHTYTDSVRSILGMEFHYCVVASHFFDSRTLIKLPINFCIQMYSKKSRVTFNYVIIGTLHSQNISIFRVIFSGGVNAKACAFIQYLILFGTAIEITVGASWSMMAIIYTNCFHKNEEENSCFILGNPYMIIFGVAEILLSQIPDIDQMWWVSMVSVVMFFIYSLIGLGLAIARVAARGSFESNGSVTETLNIWMSFEALGEIALAYSSSEILIEIQDTIRSPPSEAETMKKATFLSTVVLTTLFMLWGCVGYAALGDDTPYNIVTDFAFYRPPWLLGIANAAVFINNVGAYQIYSQPIFAFVEKQAAHRWPKFIAREREIPLPGLSPYKMNLFRLVWRTLVVILITVISMAFPLFNEVVKIITLGFWPLAVYFPVEMYIKQKKIDRWETKWVCLQMLSMACLAISIMATMGLIAGLKDSLKHNQPFKMIY